MNIYIPIEIKSRELEGRLLLALFAVERGHEVVLGGKEHTTSFAANGVLKPGIVHNKSIVAEQYEELCKIKEHGHKITVQDEEHGLLETDYKLFINSRFPSKTINCTDRIFAWGHFDYDALVESFPKARSKFVLSGSPRADLWRKDMEKFYKDDTKNGLQPYVLFVSNQTSALNANRLWVLLKMRQYWQGGISEEDEKMLFKRYAWQVEIVLYFMRAIRKVLETFPMANVVVRPHPVQDADAWPILLGECSNLVVTGDGSLEQWIKHAAVVVHEGCTSGFEAAAMDRPVIAYEPIAPFEGGRRVSNQMGMVAKTENELLNLIKLQIKSTSTSFNNLVNRQVVEEKLLYRFPNLEGPLATEQIVVEWEKIWSPELEQKNDWELIHKNWRLIEEREVVRKDWIQRAKDAYKRVIRKLQDAKKNMAMDKADAKARPAWFKFFKNAHKYPPISNEEMDLLITRFQSAAGRFHDVEYMRIGPRSFVLKRRNPLKNKP